MSSFAPHPRTCALIAGASPARLFCLSIVLSSIFSPAAKAAQLAPTYGYFSWNVSGPGTFAAQLAGVSSSMLFTTTGDDILYRRLLTPTDSDFIARFGTEVLSMFSKTARPTQRLTP